MSHAAIIAKIRKCLALAASANEHEAALVLVGLGFGIKQTETFFVEPAAVDPAVVANLGREAA